jgi:hypothetical protein
MKSIQAITVFFFIILNFQYLFASEKPQILEADINHYPRLGGDFKSGKQTFYYIIGNRNISILNDKFVVVSSINASPGVSVVDFGDVNGDSYDDLLELRRTEILVRYQRANGNFEKPLKLVSGYFISPPGTQNLEQFTFSHDLNHDGYSELIVAADNNYEFYENNGGILSKKGNLDCPYESSYSDRYWSNSDIRASRVVSKTTIPSVNFKDINRDGVDDLFCRFKTIVYYYMSGEVKGALNPFQSRVIQTYPADLSREYASSFKLEDMDSDGYFDAVFSIVSGLGIKVKTEVYIFWGKNGIPDSSNPFRWTEQGGIFTPLFLDIPGKKQLLLASLRINVQFFLSYLVEKKINLDGNIYNFGKDRTMKKVAVHEISFPVIDNYYPGFTLGDFNHDGYSDVAISNDPQEILIHFGSESMSGKNKLLIPLMGYGIMKTAVRRDGKNEILIYLPQKIKEFNPKKIYLVKFP